MKKRALTLHLRQPLTPDERRRLQAALQVLPKDPEPPTSLIDGRVCHGEIPHEWMVRLGVRLGEFVCRQISRQEGWKIEFNAAILRSNRSGMLIWWGMPGELVAIPWEVEPEESRFTHSSQPHPPILDMPRVEEYPMTVCYRVSAGILAGRSGMLTVQSGGHISDAVRWMS